MEKPSSLSDSQAPVKTGFILCMYLEKLEICHVCRFVSRDRRILIMQMEVGKSDLRQSCCIFTTDIYVCRFLS